MSFILHHYPLSPYSEKIRAMFGYANIEWQSCITSEAPPRGKLDFLSGGYSRIPIAQIGADIFCDSNIIADEIARVAKQPQLANATLSEHDLIYREWLETRLFFACVNRAFRPGFVWRIVKEKGPINLVKFLKDRIGMGLSASIPMGSPMSAPKYINQGIVELESRLIGHNFLGREQPGLLDFAAYHCFWFVQDAANINLLSQHPKALAWYNKMQAFRQAAAQEISIDQAIETAHQNEPRALSSDQLLDHRIGAHITIAPNDYRKVPVVGTLAGVDEQYWIVRRESTQTGVTHLYFPRHGVDVTLRLD